MLSKHTEPLQNCFDPHSHSNPEQVRVRHVDLDLEVLFDQKILKGIAVLTVERISSSPEDPLILDTKELDIIGAQVSIDGANYSETAFSLGEADPILGAPLIIQLPAKITSVRIEYSTSPTALGLQWLEPLQTAGKRHPFMYTQSQAIHARSWIPLQDSPGVRVTYSARVQTPPGLFAVMSAENNLQTPGKDDYSFRMSRPIPSYLIALAVGELTFKSLSNRTGVYAEPSVIEAAAWELADTEKMLEATEKLYGPYRWGRYDLLILPPSFPYGGMENPMLTFTTPTMLAGDKSLVSLIAHELAHSWAGNLVTNATWSEFWLNEGFAVYLERRIIEAVYSHERGEMEAVLGLQDLYKELERLDDKDKVLQVDLAGRDPDDGFTDIPYEKGSLFLRHLEQTLGRATFDEFLRDYFDHFAFQSITITDFLAFLKQQLLDKHPELAAKVPIQEWIYSPELPANAPHPECQAFLNVEQCARRWLKGEIAASEMKAGKWSTHEWLHFLRYLPPQLDSQKIVDLDKTFKLTGIGNAEIASQWLLLAIRNDYEPAYHRLKEFLLSIGRLKLIKPLYQELVKTPEGRARARAIYRQARPVYHHLTIAAIDEIVQ